MRRNHHFWPFRAKIWANLGSGYGPPAPGPPIWGLNGPKTQCRVWLEKYLDREEPSTDMSLIPDGHVVLAHGLVLGARGHVAVAQSAVPGARGHVGLKMEKYLDREEPPIELSLVPMDMLYWLTDLYLMPKDMS